MTDKQKSEELDECPWCEAGTTIIHENKGVWGGTKGYGEPISVEIQHWCKKEDGQPAPRRFVSVGRDKKDAIRIWNTRPQEAKLTATIKELREALEKIDNFNTSIGSVSGGYYTDHGIAEKRDVFIYQIKAVAKQALLRAEQIGENK